MKRCPTAPHADADRGAAVARTTTRQSIFRMGIYYLGAGNWMLEVQSPASSPQPLVPNRMDNVTHTLFALTLARTQLGRAGRGTTTALVLASSAPDIDIVTSARGAVSYLQWHRGPTHGPL